jgi:formylglycine-generating enzyme required for sulfatase activity
MRYIIRWAVVLCSVVAGLQTAPASAEKRVALVIGNGSYAHIAHLPNVANDAAAMAALFKTAKFDAVDVRHNLGVAELRRALRDFAGRASDADVAVLFYAGHGIEVGQVNYLIPVDARLVTDFDVEDETVPLDRVLQAMEPAKRLRLVILDACRENPFVRSMRRTVAARSVGRGLGRVEPSTTNTLIAYATRPNAIAVDGKGPNSPFTAALVKHLLTSGLDLRIALGHVRDEVLASTSNKQEPYVTGSLGGGVVSIAGDTHKPVTPVPQPQLSEVERTWAAVKETTSITALEAFRRQYGVANPVFDRLAEARVEELKKHQAAHAVPLTPAKPTPKHEPTKIEPSWPAVPLGPSEGGALRPKDSFRECDVCPQMVVVPAGEFIMGSSAGEEGPDSAAWQRKVTIGRPFAVGKFEVTFAEWDACVSAGGCKHRPDDHQWGRGTRPVIHVSWNDITKEYIPWLSGTLGKTYRLLTEAEWEYAARAGVMAPFSTGRMITTDQANFDGKFMKTIEVGHFKPNSFGLYDMHGNVSEWVEDCPASHNWAVVDGTAVTWGACNNRVLRGGSWQSHPRYLRPAARATYPVDARYNFLGFRVARTI